MKNNNYIEIDGIRVKYENEKNILDLCRKVDIEIPTFCYHSELSVYGACRLCLVDVEGMGVVASCSVPPAAGMKIKTNTAEIREIRKTNLELLLANHHIDCPGCVRSDNCKLQDLTRRLGVEENRFKKTDKTAPIDDFSPSITRDPNKCVLCGDCVRACKEVQTVGAIDFTKRGAQTVVEPAFGKDLSKSECVYCGQCVSICPTGALSVKSDKEKVWKEIHDEDKVVIAQIAPAVRVAIGEEFGQEAGTINVGQMVAALKRMGFDHVYDTSFAADLTIFEEATEFIERKTRGEKLPLFSSCCPGWVKFAEQYYPSLLPNLSSCKSPQQMFGSLAKEILPDILGIDRDKIVMVSIMPCTAKKFEAKRPEFQAEGQPDVDYVLTTTEIARMIAETGLKFTKLAPESFDLPLGFKTGGGVIFGNSGGVSEAVLRFAYEKLSGESLSNVDFHEVRGSEGLREVYMKLGKTHLSLAVVHSLKNARRICKEVMEGKSKYDFIEVMSCPGGCVVGGGQPVSFDQDFREKRTQGIYNADKMLQLHKPQENPYVNEIYKKYLEGPGSEKAHELLHTTYKTRRRVFGEFINLLKNEQSVTEVKVCIGTNCFVQGSQDILRKLMNFIEESSLQENVSIEHLDEQTNVNATFCLESCEDAPVVMVDNALIKKATFEKVRNAILKKASMAAEVPE